MKVEANAAPELPEGWSQNDDGTFTTPDGRTVQAVNYEDLEENGYTVTDDGKIIDADGNEVGLITTSQIDTDGDGVKDDVTSYYIYTDLAPSTEDAGEEKAAESETTMNALLSQGISADSDIIQMLQFDPTLSVAATTDGGYRIRELYFDAH